MAVAIAVYAHWIGMQAPRRLGFDINPVPGSDGLQLNVSEADNALDLDLAQSVAPYFRVAAKAADEIVERLRAVAAQWRTIAKKLRTPSREQERLAESFRLAE